MAVAAGVVVPAAVEVVASADLAAAALAAADQAEVGRLEIIIG